jgi:hypothetical protein
MSPITHDLSHAMGDAIEALLGVPATVADTLADAISERRRDCCRIPTPCWLPQPAGKCELTLAPGDSGVIRLTVDNCEWSARTFLVTSTGTLAGMVTIAPTTFLLHPLEEQLVLVKVSVPATAHPGTRVIGPVIVRGCRLHAVKVVVRVAAATVPSECTPHVHDCADNIHHWYDHFYCPRPCLPSPRQPSRGPNDPATGFTHG